ncbi:MAG: hypothetical protein COW00_04890 [Bdellovibrio sp. CG12_big_fil_rev_8_21_14_0_65_39_13]|nr:MAG: hypothetical protein COW78_13090 [Bdellovibrio sp. CG22_combo_CG10-13_8_21_14_all_39_27]PIQ61145.1 MAG: hypothetical protein COW00_04890 [Bdellovibrio sp. CG12_big_fil_rev_8_21_14_0_65_39_13]PIR34817.1 MAG: hypothetical protein COV37_11160 [Bdellovibrio sp. CG11_big_fil_rev_8_21_14_0_20_39_38]
MKYLFLFLIFASFSSCKQEPASQEDCENWSMLSFQGKPFEARRFKDECSSFQLKYSHSICQKALQELMMKGDLELIQKKFGEPISGCFTSDDLKRFQK